MTKTERSALRTAVADYMASEGCSCCRDTEAHKKHEKRLARLLAAPMYADKSGYDFFRFRSRREAADAEKGKPGKEGVK